MIDLKKTMLPQTIAVGGSFFKKNYKIHTDFKFFLRFRELLKDKDAPINAFDFMYISKIPNNRIEGKNAICQFMCPPHTLPRRNGNESSETVLDYEEDADLLYSAFMQQYGINLITASLHWYEFIALIQGLKDTRLNEIIEYRLWKNDGGKNDKYTKQMQKLHDSWRLPQPADNEPDEDLDEFMERLNGK